VERVAKARRIAALRLLEKVFLKMAYSNLLLLTNLGCEMLYIIDQRLSAQNISKDKSALGEFVGQLRWKVLWNFAFCFSVEGSNKRIAITTIPEQHSDDLQRSAHHDWSSEDHSS